MKLSGMVLLATLSAVLSGCVGNRQEERHLDAMKRVSSCCMEYSRLHHDQLPDPARQIKPAGLPAGIDLKQYQLLEYGKISVYSRPSCVPFMYDRTVLPGNRQAVAFLDGRIVLLAGVQNILRMRELSLALKKYCSENGQMLPLSIYELKPYLSPSFPLSHFELLTTGHLRQIKTPHDTMLFLEKEADVDGRRCAGYVDGHVEVFEAE